MLNWEADAEAERASLLNEVDLYRKLCVAMHKNSVNKANYVNETLRKWDKGGKGDVNKTEFRMGVRSPPPFGLGIDGDHKEVDCFFDSLDQARSGTGMIDGREMKEIFEDMLEFAKKAMIEVDEIMEVANRIREKANLCLETAQITANSEEAEKELDIVRATQPVPVQLGRLIVKKNVKIVDILIKWDSGGDGEVSKSEFRHHVRELGVVADTASIDACFESYDADGGGSLDIVELKPALKELAATAKASHGEEAIMEKHCAQLRKAAKKAQMDLFLNIASEMRLVADRAAKRKAEAAEAALIAEAQAKAKQELKEREAAERAQAKADYEKMKCDLLGERDANAAEAGEGAAAEVDVSEEPGSADAGAAIDVALLVASGGLPPRLAAVSEDADGDAEAAGLEAKELEPPDKDEFAA